MKEDKITVNDMLRLCDALRQAKVTSEYRLIRCFLVKFVILIHANDLIREGEGPDMSFDVTHVNRSRGMVKFALGSPTPKQYPEKRLSGLCRRNETCMEQLLKRVLIHALTLGKSGKWLNAKDMQVFGARAVNDVFNEC